MRKNPLILNKRAVDLMPRFRAKLKATAAGVSTTRIICQGDSTTAGTGSTGNHTAGQDEAAGSYPTRLATAFANAGYNANREAAIGFTTISYDPRLSKGTAFNLDASTLTFGGQSLKATTGASTSSPLAFTPASNVDTFVIWYMQLATAGVFSYEVDGGSATNVNINGSTALQSITVPAGSLGAHTLNLRYVSGSAWIVGFEAFDSTKKRVDVIRSGWAGSTSGDNTLNTNPWSPRNIANLLPDLTIIDFGINDWNASVGTSTFFTNMQTLISASKPTSDILLVTPIPSQQGTGGAPVPSVQDGYAQKVRDLALYNNVALCDYYKHLGSYNRSSSLYYDGIHLLGAGYADMSANIFAALNLPVITPPNR